MVFTKRLRDGIRSGRIRCTVRIWMRPHVKVGGRYAMDDGHIVVDSIAEISLADITYDLARESGFGSVAGFSPPPLFDIRFPSRSYECENGDGLQPERCAGLGSRH